MSARILVTGASGFVGGHVAAEAGRHPDVRPRLLRHLSPVTMPPWASEIEFADGTLADRACLVAACEGVDAVVHCASLVGADPARAAAVNDAGTRTLVEAATEAGVRRIVYVSTAAVYGRGPFTALPPDGAPIAPVSATSRSRHAAEQHVLAAGGVVLRPHLVYGRGDRWVIPGLVALLRELGATLSDCTARHSLVDAADLARVALAAALKPAAAGVHHVGHVEPVEAAVLVKRVNEALGLGLTRSIDVEAARRAVAPGSMGAHHLAMVTVDHWFTDDLAGRLGHEPGGSFDERFARHVGGYRTALAATA